MYMYVCMYVCKAEKELVFIGMDKVPKKKFDPVAKASQVRQSRYVCMCMCVYVYVYVCVRAYVCMLFMYVCMCVIGIQQNSTEG